MSAMYQIFQNTPIFQTAWRGFLGSKWTDEVNVRDFIQNNYTQYDGDESFLAAPTSALICSGNAYKSFRRKSTKRAVCSNAKLKSYPA